MYPYLLTISFILHLLAFFWIFLLSLRLKRANEIEKRQVEIQKEIEDLFQSYLMEMKEENEKLLNYIDKPTKSPIMAREKVTQQIYQTPKGKTKTKEYTPPVPTTQERFEPTLNSKVVLLHEQGFKTEEIAQKLNKGKTEIELILKFNGTK